MLIAASAVVYSGAVLTLAIRNNQVASAARAAGEGWGGLNLPGRTEWTWDFGEGLITLVATLIGVLAAFLLDRWIERRRRRQEDQRDEELTKERYAQELDAARYDLASLISICERIKGQLASLSYVTDELNHPPGVTVLLQSPALRRYGSYPLTVALTSLGPTINTIRPRLDVCHTPIRSHADMSMASRQIEGLVQLAKFAQERIEAELKRLGFGTVITDEERELVNQLKTILDAVWVGLEPRAPKGGGR